MAIPVIYEDGVFKPQVPVAIQSGTLAVVNLAAIDEELSDEEVLAVMKQRYPNSLGIATHEEAEELRQIVEAEFGQVNLDDWR